MTRSKIRTSGAEGLTLSSTDITIASGDLLFGTSAKGVNLGVTSNTDSNTLDDYEEGTYTSTLTYDTDITDTSPDETTTFTAVYTKIGNICTVSTPQLHRTSTFGADVILYSFTAPFASADNGVVYSGSVETYNVRGRYASGVLTQGQLSSLILPNTSVIIVNFQSYLHNGTGFVELDNSSSRFSTSITYTTA